MRASRASRSFDRGDAEAVMSPVGELGALLAAGGAGALLVLCWRRRAVLGLLCGGVGLALAPAALLGVVAHPAEALGGSLLATIVGAVLLMLGELVQRLLDADAADA